MINNIEKDIEFINEVPLYSGVSDIRGDGPGWVCEAIKEPKKIDDNYPIYISLLNEYGSEWRPVRQSWSDDDFVYYTNGTNRNVRVNKNDNTTHCGSTKLFYGKITKEEYIHYYRDVSETYVKFYNLKKI